jgi:SAM-dependent methyltransferase
MNLDPGSGPQLTGTRLFYRHVRDIAQRIQARRILNFGAGRGLSGPAGEVRDLRQLGEVWACDIDPVVLQNPWAHHTLLIREGEAIALPAESFDLIVSDWTFEHVADPKIVAHELLRLLRPGGMICARTPKRWGYPAIAARLVPNRLHTAVLRWAQPGRQTRDVFPTHYKLNTPSQVRNHFSGCRVEHYVDGLSPAYASDNRVVKWTMRKLHEIFPEALSTAVCFFIEKPGLNADASPADGTFTRDSHLEHSAQMRRA